MSAPWTSTRTLAVLGTGAALPGEAISTEALVDRITTRFGFRQARTALAVAQRRGIKQRHISRAFDAARETALSGQSNPALAADAVRAALAAAGLSIGDVGYLIGHTTTPHRLLPGNIADVADLLGYGGPHIELRQACTGFANALMVATGLIATAPGRPVVIVGSETGSLFFDPSALGQDPGQIVNLVQMGDGAGAIVLAGTTAARRGGTIDSAWFGSIGLDRAPGISLEQGARHFDHDYAPIRATGHRLFEAGTETAAALGHDINGADWIIPHQVSGRIGEQVAAHLGFPAARAFVNADQLGNTGSAAIWLALHALRETTIRTGERALVLGAEASKHMFGGLAYVHG